MSLSASYYPAASAPLFMDVLDQCLPDKEDQPIVANCSAGTSSCRMPRLKPHWSASGSRYREINPGRGSWRCGWGRGWYAKFTPADLQCHGYHLPGLRDSIVNLGTELNATEMADSSVFKSLVSGEPIEAREIYGKPGVMKTTCKLWFLANNLRVQARYRGRSASLEVP